MHKISLKKQHILGLQTQKLFHLGVVTVLVAIGIKEDVSLCQRIHAIALISRDAADTSRIRAAAVVCCTSRLISSTLLACLLRVGLPPTHR